MVILFVRHLIMFGFRDNRKPRFVAMHHLQTSHAKIDRKKETYLNYKACN